MNYLFYGGLAFTSWSIVQYLGFLTTYPSTRAGAIMLIFLALLSALFLGYANWCGYFNKGRRTDKEMLFAAYSVSIVLMGFIFVAVGIGFYAGVSGS
jgi:hypothetical protein